MQSLNLSVCPGASTSRQGGLIIVIIAHSIPKGVGGCAGPLTGTSSGRTLRALAKGSAFLSPTWLRERRALEREETNP